MQSNIKQKIEKIFREELSKILGERFRLRESQIKMANSWFDSILRRDFLVCEAPCGVGKSFAYLIPALLFLNTKSNASDDTDGKPKLVVSTKTKNLQDQLEKDVATLKSIIPYPFTYVTLKGKDNYICRKKVEIVSKQDREKKKTIAELLTDDILNKTREELSYIPNEIWEEISVESCPKDCELNKKCYFYQQRQKAKESDVIILNHYLFSFRYDEIIKGGGIIVIDEAHNFEDAIMHIGEQTLSKWSIDYALGKIVKIKKPEIKRKTRKSGEIQMQQLQVQVQGPLKFFFPQDSLNEFSKGALEIKGIFSQISYILDQQTGRKTLSDLQGDQKSFLIKHCEALQKAIGDFLSDVREKMKQRKKIKSVIQDEQDENSDKEFPEEYDADMKKLKTEEKIMLQRIRDGLKRLRSIKLLCSEVLNELGAKSNEKEDSRSKDSILIIERGKIQSIPLSVSENVQSMFSSDEIISALFTSGTLSVVGDLNTFIKSLGLENLKRIKEEDGNFHEQAITIRQLVLPSPFESAWKNVEIVVPSLPEPDKDDYVDKVADFLREIIKETKGGILVLTTSWSMLESISQKLTEGGVSIVREADTDYNERTRVFIQGRGLGRHHLLEEFKSDGNAVLVGTRSFWEGVDVPGSALRCVFITRLPFDPPNDPYLKAKAQRYSDTGDTFNEFYLPRAVIKFKQGIGRLIRSENDFGKIVIADVRIKTKNYGKIFLQAIPRRIR